MQTEASGALMCKPAIPLILTVLNTLHIATTTCLRKICFTISHPLYVRYFQDIWTSRILNSYFFIQPKGSAHHKACANNSERDIYIYISQNFPSCNFLHMLMDSVCDITICEGLEGRRTWVRISVGLHFSSLQCSNYYPRDSSEVKRLGREAHHSSPSSAEINACSYSSTPPIRLQGLVYN
jgi:hypothetical protein